MKNKLVIFIFVSILFCLSGCVQRNTNTSGSIFYKKNKTESTSEIGINTSVQVAESECNTKGTYPALTTTRNFLSDALKEKIQAEKEREKMSKPAAKPVERKIDEPDSYTTTDSAKSSEAVTANGSGNTKNTTTTKKNTTTTATSSAVSVNLKVSVINQVSSGFPTGCEVVSATMLLIYYGINTSIEGVAKYIPEISLYEEKGKVYGPDIREAFVGNPRMRDTSENPNYGVWAPAVTKAINAVLKEKNAKFTARDKTGCSFNSLISSLKAGNPVIVWATADMKSPAYMRSWYVKNPDGSERYFEYPKGTHVMVLSGYHNGKVTVSDPYFGVKTYDRDLFIARWNLLKTQAIVIEAARPISTTPTTVQPTTTTSLPTTSSPFYNDKTTALE